MPSLVSAARSSSTAAAAPVCALLLVFAAPAAAARGPATARASAPVRCTLPSTDLTGQVTLDPGCVYEQSLRIRASGTTLDCAGALLRPEDGYALTVTGDIADVTVRNCYVEGGNGVAVRPPNRRSDESDDALRSRAPRNVVLADLHVSGSDNVGVYLHQFTQGVVLRRSVIEGNSSAGIYLAPHGVGHVIRDNRIADNGHVKPDGVQRLGWYRREGIAVDASSRHLIEDNDIVGNALGGVLLYKNCQEHADENPNSRPRTMHASDNVIRGNRFADEPFGVWIASRQSRDLAQMGCGDPTPYDNPMWTAQVYHPTYRSYASAYTTFELPFVSVWPDFAENNTVAGNVFERISLGGVRVEDDGASVTGNLFIGAFDYVFVGAPFRARLAGHPVMDTVIADNAWGDLSAAAFEDRLALIPDEHVGTVLESNRRACPDGSGGWLRHGARLATPGSPERQCDEGTLRPVSEEPPAPGAPGDDAGSVDDAGAIVPDDGATGEQRADQPGGGDGGQGSPGDEPGDDPGGAGDAGQSDIPEAEPNDAAAGADAPIPGQADVTDAVDGIEASGTAAASASSCSAGLMASPSGAALLLGLLALLTRRSRCARG